MLVETTAQATEPTAPLAAVTEAPAGADSFDAAGAAQAAPERPTRPETIPADFWDDEKGLKADEFGKAYADLKAKFDERASAVPEKEDGYEIDTAALGLPEGIELDMSDPLAVAARKAAHEAGLTKGEFQKLAGAFVQSQLAEREAFTARLKEESAKLGPQADKRIQTVVNALSSRLGEQGKALIPLLATAPAVEALETLLRQSGTSFNQSGRAEPDPNSLPDFDNLRNNPRQWMAAIDARKRA